ncbi:MAG: NAD(P)H-hydrate epimerase [Planctomycetaceae bacterium]|nr:NAD(P)H-hydrate epimerase [Planctomycetaceae bacterium]
MSKQRNEPFGGPVADSGEPLVFTRQQIRSLDAAAVEELGISSLVLMENAARGLADVLIDNLGCVDSSSRRILIVCGPGNNGGDGLALRRQLSARGCDATALLLSAGKRLSDDARANSDILICGGMPAVDCELELLRQKLASLQPQDIIVDCLLGTGVRGAPTSPFSEAIEAINKTPARVLSADVPSGLDCQSGSAAGACIRADMTVSFAGLKSGYLISTARPWLGEVRVAHIGLPESWVRRFHARTCD